MIRQNDLFFRWSRNDNNSLGGFGGIRLPSAGNFNNNITHQFVAGPGLHNHACCSRTHSVSASLISKIGCSGQPRMQPRYLSPVPRALASSPMTDC